MQPDENEQAYQAALAEITRQLHEGLTEGHYEFTVTVKRQSAHKQCVTVKAGKSLQFIIRDDEIPS